MQIIDTDNIPIKSWCMDIEPSAVEQARNIAHLPFAHSHIALMPDTHYGFGMPIGAILACDGYIVPNAVGNDIGCGMLACKTRWTELATEELKAIMGLIRQAIPVGAKQHQKPQPLEQPPAEAKISTQAYPRSQNQVGTLGGGNHFIEIQRGSDGHIWFMLHSGSRGMGGTVAQHYNALAKELNTQWGDVTHADVGLAYLPVDSDAGRDYIADMLYCQHFAKLNRQAMAHAIITAFETVLGESVALEMHDVHHNFARLEHHFGKDVWVHRKGATSAQVAEIGIIPGSMGTKSYIVRGKGNAESFQSCSHGAGRKMGRKAAQANLSLSDEIALLDSQGIVHGIRSARDLEEAPSAYKDIDVVMEEQRDLVEVLVELVPLGVIKG